MVATQTNVVTATVTMSASTNIATGYVKMILQGGPLDGQQQLVQMLNTTTGSIMNINVPNYQHFTPDGSSVTALGLMVQYSLVGQGPPPVPANGDTWDSSWILQFVPETYTPPPAAITPPITPPQLSPAVWMGVTSSMTVNADDPSPGVWMFDTESDLDVEAVTTTFGYSAVSMGAVTTLIAEPVDWSTYVVPLEADTSMTVTPDP